MRFDEIFEKAAIKGLAFRNMHIDGYSGQDDWKLEALVAGKYAGHIDYTTYQGEVHIKYIDVPKLRRQGIATALLKELQRRHPDVEINWGSLTDDGSKLYDKTEFDIHVNAEITAKIEQLKQIKAEMAQIEAKWDSFDDVPEEQRDAWRAEMEPLNHRWNDLRDQEWDLEQELRGVSPIKKLIRH